MASNLDGLCVGAASPQRNPQAPSSHGGALTPGRSCSTTKRMKICQVTGIAVSRVVFLPSMPQRCALYGQPAKQPRLARPAAARALGVAGLHLFALTQTVPPGTENNVNRFREAEQM